MFNESVRPPSAAAGVDKYPSIKANYESVNSPGMFFGEIISAPFLYTYVHVPVLCALRCQWTRTFLWASGGLSPPQLALQLTLWTTGGLLEASYMGLDTQVKESYIGTVNSFLSTTFVEHVFIISSGSGEREGGSWGPSAPLVHILVPYVLWTEL